MDNNILPDPKNNRVVKDLKPPPHRPIHSQQLFKGPQEIDWLFLMEHLRRQGRVAKNDFIKLIQMTYQILRNQPNLIKLNEPVIIVGDLHGQYYDLVQLIKIGGSPKNTKYLFLGDYVDRGSFSIQCLILLFALKISFPTTFFLLRGNHQCRYLTSYFNFRQQCLYKYDQEIYDKIMILFDMLPISAIVNNRFFCTHGGLSPQLSKVDDINKVERAKQVPKNGIMCDLLWADPDESETGKIGTFVKNNSKRGCSYYFGAELTKAFLEKNGLISVIRAHQVQREGYKFYNWFKQSTIPAVMTVFSAPNYCDSYKNKAAIVILQNNAFNVQKFHYSEHPYILPDFMDGFTLSLPFFAEKISQILYHLMVENINEIVDGDIMRKSRQLQKIYKVYHQQAKKNQYLINMKGMCPDNKLIQSGVALAGSNCNQAAQRQVYSSNKQLDLRNERRPELQ